MDTRQLSAFCEVVDRKSFSQAAEHLGVTQPAVSLQVRSLQERVDQRLLDRSGRRVEPTEAGISLYRHARRLLQLEQQMLDDLAEGETGTLHGTLAIGASTGPGAHLVPLLLCEFQSEHPDLRVSLSISDTHTVTERVAARESSSASSARTGATARSTSSPFHWTRSCSQCRRAIHPRAVR